MAEKVKVVVRVRPLNESEIETNPRVVVDVVGDTKLVLDPKKESRQKGIQQPNQNVSKRANKELNFVFDNVCGQNATNQNVFETTMEDILAYLMEGYNCSVFTYGATGTGKTFTMIGTEENPGITYLTVEGLFDIINFVENDRVVDVAVSFLEIYNENVYDLLKPSSTPLQVREDSKNDGVMVAGLTINNVKTAKELLNMLEIGCKNRTQHPTDANAGGSWSHAVFQVYIKMRYTTRSHVRMVKLSMIDLAGSGRAAPSGCVGDRFKEGSNFNKSLRCLGHCINGLADGSNYIPYKNSKLTRLLKDSLGGNCKTVMIANISPAYASYEDTYNTLKYAAKAKKIQLSIKKNIVGGGMILSRLVKNNNSLMKQATKLQAQLSPSSVKVVSRAPDMAKEKVKQEWRERISAEEAVYSELESKLLSLKSRQCVLALRHRLRTRAASHVAVLALAHLSSSSAMEQICTEEIPRQERTAEIYMKQSVHLDSIVMTTRTKWIESKKKLHDACEQALADCPELTDFVDKVQLNSELQQCKAEDSLRQKLLCILNDEIDAVTEYKTDMLSMLNKLYFTLKGYDLAPPTLTTEYLNLMGKEKAATDITWSEDANEMEDGCLRFISSLDLHIPSTTSDYSLFKKGDENSASGIVSHSDDITDVENKTPILSAKQRKETPIELPNNENIIISDAFESLDMARNIDSATNIRREYEIAADVENYGVIDPKVLSSERTEIKKGNVPEKRVPSDRTNIMTTRTINSSHKAKITKRAVDVAMAFQRPLVQPSSQPQTTNFGFGSRVPRKLMATNQSGREKTKVTQESVDLKTTHPLSRPPPGSRK